MMLSSDWLAIAAGEEPANSNLDEADLEIATRHGLIGVMAHGAAQSDRSPVRPVYARLWSRQQVMRRHLRELLELLHRSGVRTTVLKGPALAEWAYREPALRTYTDIDLLVPRGDLSKALEVMMSYPSIKTIPDKRPQADKREIMVIDADTEIAFSLDLHWDLFSYAQLAGSAAGATEWAWDRARFVKRHELGPMYVLPEASRICFLATHAALDHRFRLILFRDLAEVAATGPDWHEVVEFARRWELRSFVYSSLLLATLWVRAEIPAEVLVALRVSSGPQRAIERLARRIDPATFDGHRPHVLNLAFVTLHDRPLHRVRLVLRVPSAVPHWWSRVSSEQAMAPRRPAALIVLTSNRRRGAEVFGSQLAEGLRTEGWSVEAVALSGDNSAAHVAAEPVVEVSPSALRGLNFTVVRGLRARVRRSRPDVILANGSATLKYSVAALAGFFRRPRLVYASIGEPSYWARGRLRKMIQKLILRRVDLVAAVSAATAAQMRSQFGVAEDKIAVAPTGVPRRLLSLERRETGMLEFRVLMIGALTQEKQPQVGVQVIEQLNDRVPALLRLVGAGNLSGEVVSESRRLGVDNRVELVGSVDDIGPHLEWADALLLTSLTEGLPGVVLEAAAAGVPTVAFDVGGTSEAIENGVTGFVVPPQDVAAAVRHLAELASDREMKGRMGEAARGRVESGFLLEHAVARYSSLLDRVTRSRRKRRSP